MSTNGPMVFPCRTHTVIPSMQTQSHIFVGYIFHPNSMHSILIVWFLRSVTLASVLVGFVTAFLYLSISARTLRVITDKDILYETICATWTISQWERYLCIYKRLFNHKFVSRLREQINLCENEIVAWEISTNDKRRKYKGNCGVGFN